MAVRFVGFMDMPAKVREGNSAEIFLNTNRVDNMPVAVVEACAMGLPVVATAVGGVPDLLTHEETGLLVPDNDDQSMVAAIMQLLKNSELNWQVVCERQVARDTFISGGSASTVEPCIC